MPSLDKVITADDRKMRLPLVWVLCVILCALAVLSFFNHFGQLTR